MNSLTFFGTAIVSAGLGAGAMWIYLEQSGAEPQPNSTPWQADGSFACEFDKGRQITLRVEDGRLFFGESEPACNNADVCNVVINSAFVSEFRKLGSTGSQLIKMDREDGSAIYEYRGLMGDRDEAGICTPIEPAG